MNPESPGAASLRARGGTAVPLEGVRIAATVGTLVTLVSVTQRYRNREAANIEAVYTFPLPTGAVLLGLELEIGDRRLAAVASPRRAASERYEEAVASGDTALLLEQPSPGVYTLNLGNLMAGETASVSLRYALANRWRGDTLRVGVPTVFAPRYGDPAQAGLAPHQATHADLGVDYPLQVSVSFEGRLADAVIECPSHRVTLARGGETTTVTLAPDAALDRDAVLTARLPEPFEGAAVVAPDGDGHVVVALLAPRFDGARAEAALNVKILVDCSGSMQGDSIAQAREALVDALESMRDDDAFSLTAFGSQTRRLADAQLPAGGRGRGLGLGFVRSLAADLGGTELRAALESVFTIRSGNPHCDVLLVTDGEVQDYEGIVSAAVASGHRVFTVGVGSAANDALLEELAAATGGACERVLPRESIGDAVTRQIGRLRTPRATRAALEWPAVPSWAAPQAVRAVYADEGLRLAAGFDAAPAGTVSVAAQAAGGTTIRASAVLERASAALAEVLPRLAAAWRILEADEALGTTLALRHNLLTRHTHLVAVLARAESERATDLPGLRTVPQMLASGWGGVGSVRAGAASSILECLSIDDIGDTLSMDSRHPRARGARTGLGGVLVLLGEELLDMDADVVLDMIASELPGTLRDALAQLVDRFGAQAVRVALLRALLDAGYCEGLERNVQRRIRRAFADAEPPEALVDEITEVVDAIAA